MQFKPMSSSDNKYVVVTTEFDCLPSCLFYYLSPLLWEHALAAYRNQWFIIWFRDSEFCPSPDFLRIHLIYGILGIPRWLKSSFPVTKNCCNAKFSLYSSFSSSKLSVFVLYFTSLNTIHKT